MRTVGAGAGTRGGGPEGVTEFLYCRDTSGPPLQGGDVGLDAEDGVSPGRLPGQGCKVADREAVTPGEGWKMVLPIHGRGFERGGCREGQDVDPLRQNTVVQFIATRPILGLCEVAEIRRGIQVPRRWWEQTGIDWKSAREKAALQEG